MEMPLPDVSATTEPGPPEPFWTAWASTASARIVGVCAGTGVNKFDGVSETSDVRLAEGSSAPGTGAKWKFGKTSAPSMLKKLSKGPCGSVVNFDFIALVFGKKAMAVRLRPGALLGAPGAGPGDSRR